MRRLLIPTLPVLIITTLTPMASGSDWPQYLGPNRNGISDESGWSTQWPAAGPKKKWTKNIGAGYAAVSISGGKVYAIGNIAKKDRISCFEEDTGTLVWKKEYACGSAKQYPGTRATPTVDDGKVYSLSREGHLFCLNAQSGEIVWQKHLVNDFGGKAPRFGLSSSVLLEGNKLYTMAGGSSGLLCLEKDSGKVNWKQPAAKPAFGSPLHYSAGGKQLLAMASSKGLLGLDHTNGKILWRVPWTTKYGINAANPVIQDGSVFLSSAYGYGCGLYKLEGGKANEVYRNKDMQNHFSTSILLDGHLYGPSGDIRRKGTLTCMEMSTGKVKWTSTNAFGPLMMADKKLIVLTTKGTLVVVEANPQGFKELARGGILGGECWTPPALANGKVFCRNTAGDLVCADLSAK